MLPATMPLEDYQQALMAPPGVALSPPAPWEFDSAVAALAAVPLILLHHEEPRELSACLARKVAAWLSPQASLAAVQVWGQALAFCLAGDRPGLPLTDLAESEPDLAPWRTILAELQAAIANEWGLSHLCRSLSRQCSEADSAIALALYCHASTPNLPRLSSARAARSTFPLASPLAATLAGASHGVWGLSRDWVTHSHRNLTASQWLAERLARRWAGQSPSVESQPLPTITVAGRLQSRLPFQVISQAEP
ncbi:MAG: hypothetical protein HC838_15755 [Spirulinaceae cyanobacterium RM2_2_10]|nr:hypothetical protein [Spirulinaceae cyanobacterium SM2_1_0]NJO21202.1 hypothetical protein [Spirulinaceae cyanobacterium RM2_2_10]